MQKHVKWTDGTLRTARPIQTQILNKAVDAWESGVQVVGLNAPPGIGKSFLPIALNNKYPKVDIITSDNNLIRQYCDTYPHLNAVMGKDNYESEEEYQTALSNARHFPSIFNPLSYYYARVRGLRTPDLIVCDEAHLMLDQLLGMSAYAFPVRSTKAPQNVQTEGELIKWCYNRYDRITQALCSPDAPGSLHTEWEKIARLRATLQSGTQNHLFDITYPMVMYCGRLQKCMVLQPLRLPDQLIRQVTQAPRVLAMSGTLSTVDAESIAAGRPHHMIQCGYPAPPENRPVYYTPVPMEVRRDAKVLAQKIREIYEANPVSTLVHCTYSQQGELESELLNLPIWVNRQHNKRQIQEKFREMGGIWLAAGCSEGIDLPYDQCQQVIIPTLLFPDKGEHFVQKRMGLADGQLWYQRKTYQSTLQRLGRGLRAADDFCKMFILDPMFSNLYTAVAHEYAPINMIWGQK